MDARLIGPDGTVPAAGARAGTTVTAGTPARAASDSRRSVPAGRAPGPARPVPRGRNVLVRY
eukprot:550294-Hanusia_phi.AAC.1